MRTRINDPDEARVAAMAEYIRRGGNIYAYWQGLLDLAPVLDPGAAYAEAVVEYVVRGGDPCQIMTRCPVCDLVNVGPRHYTPVGQRCSFGWGSARIV